MYLLGIAISLFTLAIFAVGLGGDLVSFLDFPSLFPTIGLVLAVLAATNSFKVFYRGMRSIIFPQEKLSEDMRGRAASLFRLLSKTAAIGSAMSILVCLIQILGSFDFQDPYAIYSIGHNIHTAFISLLYGLVLLVAVFEPAVFILKKRSSGGRK